MKHTKSGLYRKLTDIELRQLEVFRIVVESESFAIAEVKLNISRSRISNRLSAFEDRLGIKLMERGRGRTGFTLTPKGELVYQAINDLFGNINDFGEHLQKIQSKDVGVLRIAVPDDIVEAGMHEQISATMEKFLSRTTDVNMEVFAHAVNEVEHDVLEGRVDIAIGTVFNCRTELEYLPLPSHQCFLYCGREHPFFTESDDNLSDEVIESMALAGAGYSVCAEAANLYSLFQLKAIANQMNARLFMIMTGKYLSFLPDYYALPHEKRGNLRAIKPEKYVYQAENAAFFPRKSRSNKLVDIFVTELSRITAEI